MFSIILQSENQEPRRFDFDKEEVTIGRLSTSDISLKASNVSKQHTRIVFREGRYFIIDRKSTNGTFVNGKRVTAPVSLSAGDKVFIGDFSLTFLVPESEAKPKEAPAKPATKTVTAPPLPPKPQAAPAAAAAPEAEEKPEEPKLPELVPQEEEKPEPALDMYLEQRYQLFSMAIEFDEFESGEDIAEYRLDDEEVVESVSEKLSKLIEKEAESDLPADILATMHAALLEELLGYGCLEKYLYDDTISEIFINGPTRIVLHRGNQKLVAPETFTCEEALLLVLNRMLAPAGVDLEEETAIIDVKLPEGFAFAGVLYPYSLMGTSLRISKTSGESMTMDTLQNEGVLNDDIATYLQQAVNEHKTVLVTGRDDNARFHLLGAIANLIPDNERLALVNAGAGLLLPHPDQVSFEGIVGDVVESDLAMGTGDLLRHLGRLSADRLILKDLREDAAIELLYALDSGLCGSVFSLFGHGAVDAAKRLARMAVYVEGDQGRSLVNELIDETVDVIITIDVYKSGDRRVSAVSEWNEGKAKDVFVFNPTADTAEKLEGDFAKK